MKNFTWAFALDRSHSTIHGHYSQLKGVTAQSYRNATRDGSMSNWWQRCARVKWKDIPSYNMKSFSAFIYANFFCKHCKDASEASAKRILEVRRELNWWLIMTGSLSLRLCVCVCMSDVCREIHSSYFKAASCGYPSPTRSSHGLSKIKTVPLMSDKGVVTEPRIRPTAIGGKL